MAIVRHCHIDERVMHMERIRPDEIFSEMHTAGIERLSRVKWDFEVVTDGDVITIRGSSRWSKH